MMRTASNRIYSQFPALQYRNYRLYFIGQLVSFLGSWLQGFAFGWLVFTITHSAFWLGVVTAASSLPVLFLSLFGGFLVDKFNRKKLLLFTQSSSLILAFILGLLTMKGFVSLPSLLIITFLSGVVNALDNPTTQAFVVDIVGKEELPSAVGLNSVMFNTGRVLGPAVAGFLIGIVGIGNIFFINAASFLAILVSIYFIQTNYQVNPKQENPVKAIKEGVAYSASHQKIRVLLLTAGMGAIFCFSQATIMPVLVSKVFGNGTQQLGILLSAMGLGALLGSLIVSSQYKRVKPSTLILLGCSAFLFSTFIFSFSNNLLIASVLLFIAGLGLTIQFSTVYSTIQRHVQEEFRGRVSSIYVLLFVGFSPLGNIFIGLVTSLFGPQEAIRLCTYIIFAYGLVVYVYVTKDRLASFKYTRYARSLKPLFAFMKT